MRKEYKLLYIPLSMLCISLTMGAKAKPTYYIPETTVYVVAPTTEAPTLSEIESTTVEVETTTEDMAIKCIWGGFELSQEEYELLCRTVFCEAGNQNIETQKMVALTILNRVYSDNYADNLEDVVYQNSQYSVTQWKHFEEYSWTDQVEQAVHLALQGNDYPLTMYYFRTKHFHNFGKHYKKSGDLYFSIGG